VRRSLCVLLCASPWCSIHEHRVSSLFSTLINTTNAPSVIVQELSRILVRLATSPPDADHGAAEAETREKSIRVARSLLSLVHQRHLELLRGVAGDVLSEAGPNGDKKERKKMANELLTSFSLVSDTLSIAVFETEAVQTSEPPISRVQQCKRGRSCICKHVQGHACYRSGDNVLDVGGCTK
jgi:hypothetical protein